MPHVLAHPLSYMEMRDERSLNEDTTPPRMHAHTHAPGRRPCSWLAT